MPLPDAATACPRCGLEVPDAAPPPKPPPPKPLAPFRRSTSAPNEMTQIVEVSPEDLLPSARPAAPAAMPPPERADRRGIALAICLGLLAGALVLLLLAGIVRSRQPAAPHKESPGRTAGASPD